MLPPAVMVVRALWLYTLQHTQFVVTGLTAYCILRIRTAHSLWFGAGSLVAAFSGTPPLPDLLARCCAHGLFVLK